MRQKAITNTASWHALALAFALTSGCSAEPTDRGQAAEGEGHAGPEQQAQPTRGVESIANQEQREPERCAVELQQLLERADIQTPARVDCGGFRLGGLSSAGQGIVGCFLQQSVERKAAAEFRFTSGGIDSGPVTYFVADGAGSLWSVEIHDDPFGSSRSVSSVVSSCSSLELSGSGYVYCNEPSLLYSCNGPG